MSGPKDAATSASTFSTAAETYPTPPLSPANDHTPRRPLHHIKRLDRGHTPSIARSFLRSAVGSVNRARHLTIVARWRTEPSRNRTPDVGSWPQAARVRRRWSPGTAPAQRRTRNGHEQEARSGGCESGTPPSVRQRVGAPAQVRTMGGGAREWARVVLRRRRRCGAR